MILIDEIAFHGGWNDAKLIPRSFTLEEQRETRSVEFIPWVKIPRCSTKCECTLTIRKNASVLPILGHAFCGSLSESQPKIFDERLLSILGINENNYD